MFYETRYLKMSSTECKLFPDSFKTHGTIGTDVFKPWFLFMRKSHETKTLHENLKETFTICFRARLKKGWVVWDPSCFFGES